MPKYIHKYNTTQPHLDLVRGVEPVELVEQLEHGPLHLAIAILAGIESLRADRIQLIDEDDCTPTLLLLHFLLRQFEGVTDQLGTVANEHLYELWPG